ncbi:MAG: YegS/Rv2252/BmrU family lipid kinase [Oscillospiraceae bacterium]|nr:YegS/Rv2252/BmrU family lipid kinase [Oscillospiraceae bacterium]
MKKLLFIMNPFAGQRRANRFLADILTVFNRADYDVTVYMTAGPGDGARAVEERSAQMDLIVCCGGDGTFNETVTGMIRAGADVPLGYIPAGSTNDFAASLRLPTNPVKAAQAIVEGKPRRYDVGRFGGRYFTYVASFGAFTRVSYATPQSVKNALGHTAYLLEGIQELSQLKNLHVRLELDEGRVVEDDFLFGAISNSTSVGGILTLDPKQVDMSDGKFELLLVRAPQDLSEVSECLRALQTQKYNCRMITFLSASHVRVTAEADMVWTLDGEREEGSAVVEADILHHRIQLLQREEA